ncbi:MAG: hypothetical protein HFG08_05395 [Oscillibacter sp.]|jgi:hypothetical protein|nr:hypothetical protein [Oscillibacter sp.]
MKRSSLGIKFLMLAITLGILVYFSFQIFNYFDNPLSTTMAYNYSVDECVEITGGYVIRREEVLPDDDSDLLRLQRKEGERVSSGGMVAMVYVDQASLDRQSEMESLAARIEQLEYAQESAYGYEANVKLDAQIAQSIRDVRGALAAGRLDTAESHTASLRAMVLKRDFSWSDLEDVDTLLDTLRQELRTLRSQTAGSVRRISAPKAGLYSAVVDGYETVLMPESMEGLTPSQMASIQADPAVKSNVGKLILGDTWYYAAVMPAADIKTLREARDLSLRFSKGVERDLPVTIQSVGTEENGRSVVIFQGKTYLSHLTLLRQQSAQVITNTLEGIRVPKEALRILTKTKENEDGSTSQIQISGIYCIIGSEAWFKPVEILYNGEGFLLVQSASQDEKLRLRPGDEVIISAQDLYDGKVVRKT